MSTPMNLSPWRRYSRRLRAEPLESRRLLSGVPAGTVDLGVVDFLELSGQQPTDGQLWYRLEAAGDGLLTADLPQAQLGANLELKLFTEDTQDQGGNLQEQASGLLRVDLESAIGGQQYVLQIAGADAAVDVRLTNLVTLTEEGAIVYGTAQDDLFEFEAAARTELTINGVGYSFDFSSIDNATVVFLGEAGEDTALLTGSAGNDAATFEPLAGEVVGPGYRVGVTNTEQISFEGGGGDDSATLFGSEGQDSAMLWPDTTELVGPGYGLLTIGMASTELDADEGDDEITYAGSGNDETIQLGPDYVEIQGAGVHIQAWGFETAIALAGSSNDLLTFYDSAGNDDFTFSPDSVSLTGVGFSLTAYDFAKVQADASEGGHDTATFQGTAQADTVELWPDYVEFLGGGAFVQVWDFETVAVDSGPLSGIAAGSDAAIFHDSAGDDHFEASPEMAVMTGSEFSLTVTGFATVEADALEGGDDMVELFDSAGDDQFVGTPTYAKIEGEGFSIETRYFDEMVTYANGGGTDVAKFFDSPGNDTYVGKATYNALSGDGFENVVRYFEGVHVYATAGGIDVATFYDSSGDDNYVATATYAALYNDQFGGENNDVFFNRAKYFEAVHAYATAGGNDLARFYDSPADDDYVATPTYAALFNAQYQQEYTNGFYNRAKFFEGVHAYATAGGSDLARLYDSPEDDVFYADPIQGALYNTTYEEQYTRGFYNRAKFFEGVHAYATAGGSDEARLFGSEGDDRLAADATQGAMYLPGQYYNRAKFFEKVYADAGQGGHDEAYLVDSPEADLLEAEGSWARLSRAAADFLYEVDGFDYVKATATTGDDMKSTPPLSLLLFTLEPDGPWKDL